MRKKRDPNKNIIITTKLNKHQHKCNIYLSENFFHNTKKRPAIPHNALHPKNPPYIPFKAEVTILKSKSTYFKRSSTDLIVFFMLSTIDCILLRPDTIALVIELDEVTISTPAVDNYTVAVSIAKTAVSITPNLYRYI